MSALGYAERPQATSTPALFGRVMGSWRSRSASPRSACSSPAAGRRRLVHRVAAGDRLPGRAQLRERPRQHQPRAGTAVRVRAADRRQRRRRPSTTTPRPTPPRSARRSGRPRCSSAALGSAGYAIRRDLSYLYRLAFWLLLALMVAGIVLIFVRIPAAYTIYAMSASGSSALYTVIDFNRLRRAGNDEAIPLAAAIFLDVLNIFLFFLQIFGRVAIAAPRTEQLPRAPGAPGSAAYLRRAARIRARSSRRSRSSAARRTRRRSRSPRCLDRRGRGCRRAARARSAPRWSSIEAVRSPPRDPCGRRRTAGACCAAPRRVRARRRHRCPRSGSPACRAG